MAANFSDLARLQHSHLTKLEDSGIAKVQRVLGDPRLTTLNRLTAPADGPLQRLAVRIAEMQHRQDEAERLRAGAFASVSPGVQGLLESQERERSEQIARDQEALDTLRALRDALVASENAAAQRENASASREVAIVLMTVVLVVLGVAGLLIH